MRTEESLPCNIEAERALLGSIFLKDTAFLQIATVIQPTDFMLDKHQLIFRRMADLHQEGKPIHAITLAGELTKRGELQSCDGLEYLVSLTDGVPITNTDIWSYMVKEKARLRRLATIGEQLRTQALSDRETAEQILEGISNSLRSPDLLPDESANAEDTQGIIRRCGGIEQFLAPSSGIAMPWPGLFRITQGWQNGDLILLAARPSMGKTALALNAIWHAASRGIPSVFYTYEMSQESIVRRLVSLIAHVPYQDLQRGELNVSERRAVAQALEHIQASPLLIIQASSKGMLGIRAHAERAKREGKLAFAAVDYIGLIPSNNRTQNRNQELGEICRQLKQLAGDLNSPLLVLSQLNRATETRQDKRPLMSDLRDSGELENHADLIAFLHRAGYYNREDASLRTHAELIVAKQRNGDTPIVRMVFRREYGHFGEAERCEQVCA